MRSRTAGGLDAPWLVHLVLILGVGLGLLLLARSQVAGDQLNMLARGWLLVADGELVPYGLPTSGGGKEPGSFTSLIVGLPLWLWQHHRAPTLLILGGHLVGFLLLDRVIRVELGPVGRFLFAILYWLNPWRAYHSGFLWNPNYLLPLGAVHCWTIFRQQERGRFWESFLQVVAIGLAMQLHVSAVTLALLSLILWSRGYFRFHWPAVGVAATAVVVSLVPWVQAVLQDPSLLPRGPSPAVWGPTSALSLLRGVGYWIRYPALVASSTILCLDFGSPSAAAAVEITRLSLQIAVGGLTVPVVIWANLELWRHSGRWWRRAENRSGREWLEGVVRWSFLVTLLVCSLSPTAVMSWQLLTVLHLAILPVVLLGTDLMQTTRSAAVRRATWTHALLATGLTVAIAFGSPMFRCAGERCNSKNATPPQLRSDHVMLDELGIDNTCVYEVNHPGGWWPDVLPESQPTGLARLDAVRAQQVEERLLVEDFHPQLERPAVFRAGVDSCDQVVGAGRDG